MRVSKWFPQIGLFLLLWTIAFITFLGFGLGIAGRLAGERDEHLRSIAHAEARALAGLLEPAYAAVYSFAFLMEEDGDASLAERAGRFLERWPMISHISIAPDGIVRTIFPLAGNEAAVGLDLFADPARRADAIRARDERVLVVTGPYKLAVGGYGLTARYPIFRDQRFWGLAVCVVKMERLVELSGLPNLEARGFRWTLRTMAANGTPGDVFAASAAGLPFDSVDVQVTTPFAAWILSLGTGTPNTYRERIISTLLAAGAATGAATLFGAFIRNAYALTKEVRDRREAERRLAASLAEKETLMREIHHRIKNNLAIIESIISLQSEEAAGSRFEESFAQLAKRVHSITLIHEKLYKNDLMDRVPAQAYLTELVRHIVSSMGCGHEEVALEVADIELNTRTALPVGLILTELCTNALKYGCESGLRVSLKETDQMLSLTVEDDGPPPPEDFREGCGLGLRLVDSLSDQLAGTWLVDNGPPVRFIVEFPVSLALADTASA